MRAKFINDSGDYTIIENKQLNSVKHREWKGTLNIFFDKEGEERKNKIIKLIYYHNLVKL